MTQQRIRAVAIWGMAVWPACNFIAANWEEVLRGGFSSILGVLAIAFAMGTVGHILLRIMWRFWRVDIVVLWVVAMSLFFGYLAMRNLLMALFTWLSLEVPPSVGWFLVAGILMCLAWRLRRVGRAQVAAITFSIVGSGFAAIMLAMAALSATGSPADEVVRVAQLPGKPESAAGSNIYYIILDGYAGFRGLGEALDFDNSEFERLTADRGFRNVSSERSNYLRTVQTIGGIFSLEYPLTEDPRTWKDKRRLYPTQFDGVNPPVLIGRLRDSGYAIWFSASFIAGCPKRHVRCIGRAVGVDGAYMTQTFLTPTPLGRVLLKTMNFRRNALDPMGEHLPDLLAGRQPMFVFVHHLAPHAPYSLDRYCESRHPGKEFLDNWRALDREGYLEALQCVNTQVKSLLDRILTLDPGALVVLQSDHGSDLLMDWDLPMASWPDAAVSERASFLNLIRSPPACAEWLDRPLGQINTARFVIACAEGRSPEYLDERTYISTYSLGPEQDEVRAWRPD